MPRLLTLLILAAAAGGATLAYAQKATEIYIPLGESPGVSGVTSTIGMITSCDEGARTLTIQTDEGTITAMLSDGTRIWIDRSPAGRPNVAGSAADCREGRRAEIKFVYQGETRTTGAEWIKIRESP